MTKIVRMPFTVELNKWTKAQISFLVSHYAHMGDVEMSEQMNQRFPRKFTPWTRKRIAKKRVRMELFRTPEQLMAIRQRNNRQQRYNTEPARQTYKLERDQVTDNYILSICFRHPKSKHAKIKQEHGLLIELTRRSIIRKRAERILYAVQ